MPDIRTIRVANGGDLVARNIGLAAVTAPHVAFCDSDDLWRPGFLAAMAGLFAAVPSGFWDGLRRLGPDRAVFDQPIVARLIRFQPLCVSGLVARAEWLRGIGGWDASVGRRLADDFATALRLAQHAPLGFLLAPLVGIRKHAANISGNDVATALGEAEVLEHVLATRPELAPLAAVIGASIRRRDPHRHPAGPRSAVLLGAGQAGGRRAAAGAAGGAGPAAFFSFVPDMNPISAAP